MSTVTPLTPESITSMALTIADRDGIERLSMRHLGNELGVEAMAIYHHFANKQALVESMLGMVHREITLPADEPNWRKCMRIRAESVIEVLSRHPWAASRMESGTSPTADTMRDREYMARCLRIAGFSIEATVHAISILDIYIYGAAQQYVALTFTSNDEAATLSDTVVQRFSPHDFPYFSEILADYILAGKYNPLDEFRTGLELVLDSIEQLR